MQYRKKPIVIEARQFHNHAHWAVAEWCGGDLIQDFPDDAEDRSPYIVIHTFEGDHRAQLGDWIITGIRGEFYPCKPAIFEQTYEKVEVNV